MTVMQDRASVVNMAIDKRALDIRARREYLGMSKAGLAKLAGVDRGKLQRFEDGEDTPSDRWIGGVVRALDDFAHETGHDPKATGVEAHPGFVRITVEGVYGANALVVEGPPENMDDLVRAVDKIMRGRQTPPAD